MEFVKVRRDDLIEQFKGFIELLKKCDRDTDFHVLVEFCGIDKKFLEVARQNYEKKMKEQAKERQRQEKEGNI